MLKIKNLKVKVAGREIIKGLNFNFEKNKTYAIMGPNGSGKSTLAFALMGHPAYKLGNDSKINYQGKNITKLQPEKRAKLGIFLSFQTPLSLAGINVFQLLRLAKTGNDPFLIKKKIAKLSHELKINEELLTRSLNDGASGGEKKKMEVLQAAILDPKLLIFDEVDTGVDIDALKIISEFINSHKKGKTYIVITHYNRILKYLKPDKVLVMIEGKIVKTGNYKLAENVEKKGYAEIAN